LGDKIDSLTNIRKYMLNLSYKEKLDLMRSLNWDYLDTYEDMLSVIEGRIKTSGAFTRDKLFVRSLERRLAVPITIIGILTILIFL